MGKSYKDLTVLLFFGLMLPLIGSVVSFATFNDLRFAYHDAHVLVEAFGAVIAVLIFLFLCFNDSLQHKLKKSEIIWVSSAIVGMGVLDGFHAFVPVGNNFVWLHSVATLVGGVLFAGVLLPKIRDALFKALPFLILAAALLLGVISVLMPAYMPKMLVNGEFTFLARFLNIAGGAGFILASLYFFKQYKLLEQRTYYLLSAHCLLFGSAGVLFEISSLWDAAWWWWHGLRLAAYSVLISFFLQNITKSLSNKIILLVCTVTFLTALVVGGLSYARTTKITLDTAIEGLAGETRLISLRFKSIYDVMKNDAQVVSYTPPIKGFIRSTGNKNLDPLDGSTTKLWRERLGTIFMSVMASRPHYTQMRYIGVADLGRELVRVNRTPSGLEKVPENQLQQKGKEPYFLAGLETKKGSVYFSEVTYNREHGQVDENLIPTVRAVWPIYNFNNEIYGMIVINADYEKLLKESFENIKPKNNTVITNHSGDYMEYHNGVASNLELHYEYTKPVPEFIQKIQNSIYDEATFIDEGKVSYLVRLHIDVNNPNAFLGVVNSASKEKLFAGAYQARKESILISFALILLASVVATFFGRRLTRPLRNMTESISQSDGKSELDLPVELQDEIGDLAGAFRRMTNSLMESEERNRVILNSAIDGIITIDENAIIESYNPACEQIFGFKAEEVIGKNVKILMPEPHKSGHDGYLKNYHETGEKKIIGANREVEGKKKNGVVFPMELSISEIVVADKKLFTGIVRDITARKEAEEEIKKVNKELESFTYIASHDLRSPLVNLKGYSAQIEKYIERMKPLVSFTLDKIPEEQRESLKKIFDQQLPSAIGFISSSVDRMDNMTNAILQLSRTGSRNFNYTEVKLKDLLENFVNSVSHQLAQRNAEVKIGEIPNITADYTSIEQIFGNLIDNAIKYLSPDRPGLIEIGYTQKEHMHEFFIKDNGIGVAEKDYDKVFAIFRRAGNTKGTEGQGMGLNYVRSLVNRYGGNIWFKSEVGKGTKFYFTINKNVNQQKELQDAI